MAVPLVRVNEFGLYVRDEGATSFTTNVKVVVSLPPVLLAVTVYVAEEVTAEGVPEMAPVEESMESPAGREGKLTTKSLFHRCWLVLPSSWPCLW